MPETLYVRPIGSRYLLRMVLEVKVLPENGLGGSKDIRFGWSWTLREVHEASGPRQRSSEEQCSRLHGRTGSSKILTDLA